MKKRYLIFLLALVLSSCYQNKPLKKVTLNHIKGKQDTFVVAGTKYDFLNAEFVESIGSKTPNSGVYLVVNMRVTNVDNHPRSARPFTYGTMVYDSKKNYYQYDYDLSKEVGPLPSLLPGGSGTFSLVFNVPDQSRSYELEIQDWGGGGRGHRISLQ
jgi:hypothetical protein